ncbi:MAG: ABC transporter ATP-binding protein [Lachnospiraceae bacterium]|nr:ABC transporter ATP-binding protein [Lachnospiraceae bacterium]
MPEIKGPSLIKVRDLFKIYKLGEERVAALNGVDLDIEAGEFAAIVGASGSGKSTLLNMLAGLEPPTRGSIEIAGERIEKYSESKLVEFRRRHVGFIFQSYNLMPSLNAVENVALPLVFRGMDKVKREKLAIQTLEKVGLKKYMRHRPTEMSGGQQQRVGIARALVLKPDIIFADEPTGNLDSVTTLEVMKLLREISGNGKNTLCMVTHDDNLSSYADRVIRIKDGKVIENIKIQRG